MGTGPCGKPTVAANPGRANPGYFTGPSQFRLEVVVMVVAGGGGGISNYKVVCLCVCV